VTSCLKFRKQLIPPSGRGVVAASALVFMARMARELRARCHPNFALKLRNSSRPEVVSNYEPLA
jgi:hypothetical protein